MIHPKHNVVTPNARAASYLLSNDTSRKSYNVPPADSKHHNPIDTGALGRLITLLLKEAGTTKLHRELPKMDNINAILDNNDGPKHKTPLALQDKHNRNQ